MDFPKGDCPVYADRYRISERMLVMDAVIVFVSMCLAVLLLIFSLFGKVKK